MTFDLTPEQQILITTARNIASLPAGALDATLVIEERASHDPADAARVVHAAIRSVGRRHAGRRNAGRRDSRKRNLGTRKLGRCQVGKRGRQEALQYSWAKVTEAVLDIYTAVLGRATHE